MSVFRLTEPPVSNSTETDSPESNQAEPIKKLEEINESVETSQPSEAPGKIKEIILKGPLGHAYTEALNLLLDKKSNPDREIRQEGVYQSLQAIVLSDEKDSDPNIPGKSKAYVYVYDGKKMELGDIANLYEDLTGKKSELSEDGYVTAVIENPEKLIEEPKYKNSMDTLVMSLESHNIPLYFSRNAAINGVVSFLKK